MQQTDAQRRLEWLLIMAEEGIDTSDSPSLPDEAWNNAIIRYPDGTRRRLKSQSAEPVTVSVSLPPETLAFYKSLGENYELWMQAAFVLYAETHKLAAAK